MSNPRRVDLTSPYLVRIKAPLHAGRGQLVNLGKGGAYVGTPMSLLPTTQVLLQVVFPGAKRGFEVEAIVSWENRQPEVGSDLPPGYGLRFVKVPERSLGPLNELLSSDSASSPSSVPSLPADPDLELPAAEAEAPPYKLVPGAISRLVPDREKGVYVLSFDGTQDARVGRADTSLQSSLSKLVGEYAFFYFEGINDDVERYERECELYHRLGGDHGQLDNEQHPQAPEDSGFSCPVCPSS